MGSPVFPSEIDYHFSEDIQAVCFILRAWMCFCERQQVKRGTRFFVRIML